MGHKEDYHWDENKSSLLKEERGYGLDEICEMVFYDRATKWEVFENPNYPNQYRIIAKTSKSLFITLAVEDLQDEFGYFTKLVTWWPSSAREKERIQNE